MTEPPRNPPDSPLRIAVVCEAEADQWTACALADRVLCAYVKWLEPETLDGVRTWCGTQAQPSLLAWKNVRQEADRLGLAAQHGNFRGEPGDLDARAARRALWILKTIEPACGAAMLIRDSDGLDGRRRGLQQARDDGRWPFAVVIGVAHTKRECWLLAAFEPEADEEHAVLNRLRQELGFDPLCKSHELTAQRDTAKRSAKRVWASLCGDNSTREQRCLENAALGTLNTRGKKNGLCDYLNDVETNLVPLLPSRRRGA